MVVIKNGNQNAEATNNSTFQQRPNKSPSIFKRDLVVKIRKFITNFPIELLRI